MEQPIDDIAETAVNALRSLIDDPQKPLPDYSFRPRLTVRASTAAPTRRLELHAEAALGDATADRRTDDDQADDHHHHRDRNHRRQAVGKPDRAACDGRLRLGWSGLTNQPETRITFDTWAATSCDPDDARSGHATLG